MENPKNKLIIAAIGDSVTAGFYVASELNMFLRMWAGKKHSWFSEIVSQIKKLTPVVSYNYSSAGSKLADKAFTPSVDKLLNIKSMESQVDRLLAGSFPDMTLVWIGHNELNWTKKIEKDFTAITAKFQQNFQKQLERLCVQAMDQNKQTVIIVFGFINIRSLFSLREAATAQKKQNLNLFPYFEKGYTMFPAIRPEHREPTIKLADMMDIEMSRAVAFCQSRLQNQKCRIIFSDTLSKVSTNSLEHVTPIDGWHPSMEGHKQLAEAAWPVIEQQLGFLLSSSTKT